MGLSDVNNGYLADVVAAFNNMMSNDKFADICSAAPKGTQLVARRSFQIEDLVQRLPKIVLTFSAVPTPLHAIFSKHFRMGQASEQKNLTSAGAAESKLYNGGFDKVLLLW